MGKKQKGGRRQILQLEDKKPPRSSSKNRIKNLIHYSDSDEDSKKSNDSERSSTIGNKEGCPLDSQVADFFKEIDALTVNEESADPSESSVAVENDLETEKTFNGLECKNSNTDEKLLERTITTESDVKIESYCPWQEIPDDSTGYSYYWNVETNEVTWDCPEEYAAYISAMSSSNADSQIGQNEEMESLKKLQRKKESQLIEGAIIPISYFGDTSSSDESEDSHDSYSKMSSKRKKEDKCSTNKGKSSKIGHTKSEQDKIDLPSDLIGPQLPPEYRFTEEVESSAEEKLELSSNLQSAVCDHVESRTIDQSNVCVHNMAFSEPEKTSDVSFDTCIISSSQSNLNIASVGPSISKDCEDFEMRKKSIVSNTEKGESPDSTMKQGDVLTSTGLGLVEYNSFTDDEEEIDSSNLSPIDHDTGSNDMLPNPASQACHDEKSIENNEIEAPEPVIELNDTIIPNKRKNIDESNETIQELSLIRKAKKSKPCNAVDIDSMFASHLSNQKHGFGFVKQNIELVDSDSCSDQNQDYRTNRRNDYKSVSFVKSEHVLDLSELNSGIVSEEQDPLLTNADSMLSNQSSKNSLGGKSIEHDFIDEEHFIKEQIVNEKENTTDSTVVKSLSDCESKDLVHEIVATESHHEIALIEEDIDEIDKALCEALVAKKKLENSSGNTLPSTAKIKLESISSKIGSPVATPKLKDMSVCCVEDPERDGADEDNKPTVENDKISILDLSSCLVDKLTFLISNHSSLSSLSALLVQLQTRLVDWQASALENEYFIARLEEVNQYICQYEMSIVSGDWICQWDRENKRYYYVNSRTQQSQWTYPDDLSLDLKTSWTQSQMEIPTPSASSCISEQDEHQTVSSSSPVDSGLKNKSKSCKTDKDSEPTSSKKPRKSSPPPPPPGVDSPPPPPPCSPPPHSPPPPPPDSTEVTCDLTEDMDLENSNDSCSPLIISNSSIYEANQIQCSPMLVCSSNSSIKNCGEPGLTNIVTSTLQTANENANIISTSHQAPVSLVDINSHTCVLWSAPRPSCSSETIKHSEAQNSATSTSSTVTSQASDNVCDPCSSSVTNSSSTDGVPNKASTSSGTVLKKEKKKMKLLSVLALKKKNIPSLVEKWQKIKEEQEKEDNS